MFSHNFFAVRAQQIVHALRGLHRRQVEGDGVPRSEDVHEDGIIGALMPGGTVQNIVRFYPCIIVAPVHREKSATEASKRSASTPVKDVATVTVVPAGKEPYCSASSAQVAVGPARRPPSSGAQAGRPAAPVHRAVTSARRRSRRRKALRKALRDCRIALKKYGSNARAVKRHYGSSLDFALKLKTVKGNAE